MDSLPLEVQAIVEDYAFQMDIALKKERMLWALAFSEFMAFCRLYLLFPEYDGIKRYILAEAIVPVAKCPTNDDVGEWTINKVAMRLRCPNCLRLLGGCNCTTPPAQLDSFPPEEFAKVLVGSKSYVLLDRLRIEMFASSLLN